MNARLLTAHPSTPCPSVRALRVQAHAGPSALELHFELEGELAHLAIPARIASRRGDRLWQHSCFEAFVRGAGARAYLELNFSPSTEWAIYRFSSYRADMQALDPSRPPRVEMSAGTDTLSLHAAIGWDLFGTPDLLELALSAVIEQADGRLSYWALAHPPGKPDFHHAAGFVLALGRGRTQP